MRRRLDAEMVRRGMAASRTEAALAIRSGQVTVGGRPAAKSSMLVDASEPIVVSGPPRRFVSRGGEKLDAALDRFAVEVSGRMALDVGASTGGFTDCLLSRGAVRVAAVDVGRGQLDWRLREDPRVTVLERTNARDLRPEDVPFIPDVVTADLSFISLRLVLPALARVAPRGEFVLLIKPQFEAGREQAPGGVVRDPDVWRRVLGETLEAAGRAGLEAEGVMASPLLGPAGNVEFFVHARSAEARRDGEAAGADIDAAVREGTELATRHG